MELSATIASEVGRAVQASEARLRSVVVAGAAGGFAAILGAPFAAPFFAVELLLRRFAIGSFCSAAVSGVTAFAVTGALSGRPPDFDLASLAGSTGPAFAVLPALGVLAGVVGVVFGRMLFHAQRLCNWAWRWPQWLRPAVGGVALGWMLMWLPQLYGVGDPAVHEAMDGTYALGFPLVLLAAKLVASTVTFGVGGYGGLFGPMLFLGTMSGLAFGEFARDLGVGGSVPIWYFGMLGIGAVLATGARAPITAVILPVELAGSVVIVPALVVTVVAATVVGHLLTKESVFAVDLIRRARTGRIRNQPAAP